MAQNKGQLFDGSALTSAIVLPSGTTEERPSSPVNGMLRYNTTLNIAEQYANGQWNAITSPPTIASISLGGITVFDDIGGQTITINGSSFRSGIVTKFRSPNGTEYTSPTTTLITGAQLTAVLPDVSATGGGDYDVKVINSDGGESSYVLDAIPVNGVPTFVSPAAGSLGSFYANQQISTITLLASEPDGGAITYSVTTGSLPPGLSLNSGTGQITGTPNSVSSSTTSSFTVTATDDESQTATRNYSITVLPNYLPSTSAIIG